MTIEKASKIIEIYGIHLEYCSKLIYVFSSHIPESFLPFPKNIIEKASDVMAEHYHNNGNNVALNSIEVSRAHLISYINDEEAILQAVKFWNEHTWREAILPAFKNFQSDWIESRGINLD